MSNDRIEDEANEHEIRRIRRARLMSADGDPEGYGEPPPEQPAPEGEGWRYVQTAYSGHVVIGDEMSVKPHWRGVRDAECVRAIMKQIVTDHRLAALVPGLLAGLEAALAVGVTGPALRQRLENEVKQARATLAAVAKERAL